MTSAFQDIGVIDTMLTIPEQTGPEKYGGVGSLLRGQHAKDAEALPVSYMFKDAPDAPIGDDPLPYIVGEMDRYGVECGVVALGEPGGATEDALKKFPNRFLATTSVDPNDGMEAVRSLERGVRERGARAVFVQPAFVAPQVPINDKRWYPIYAKCIELDVPVFMTVGVPGPRVPMHCQHVELLDEVCWFFPELKIIMRHGAEPWESLAVKLMLKWPNLYYSTSAFAPKHYPAAIVEYANTRGADKILYAGYFPVGLSLERIFRELPEVPFRDHVWPKFLRENAMRLLTR